MAQRTTPVLLALCLSLTAPLVAQRPDSKPSGKPSGGSVAPAPRPSPAPAPRPSAQPAPRPSAAPAPAPRPPVSAPSPRPSAPAPSSRPQYEPPARSTPVRPSTPDYSPPARTNPSNPAPRPYSGPAPRTSTGTDTPPVRATPPRYQPPANDGSRPDGGTITRPSYDTPAPVGRPVTRPADTDARRPGAPLDSRYRPSPSIERPAPTSDRPRQPAGTPAVERDTLRPSPRRPVDAPSASTRYRPADTINSGARVVAPSPRPSTGSRGVVAGSLAGNVTSTPVSPVLAAVEPRLSQPRAASLSSGVLAQRSGWSSGSYGSHWHHRHYSSCHPSWWYGYWDPWYCHSSYSYGWYDCNAWSFGISGGSFGWSLSLWYPYWYCRNSYWDRCYHDSFWCSWSQPNCVSTSYWWYPSTTYCPTYLYVPSTVYVTESEPAPAPASTEVVVAGGGVVGSARVIEDRASGDSLSMSLAMKYVELGDFYFKADRFRDAAEAYGKARSYAPDDASVHFVLADAVFADGDYHYAAFLIAEGVRLDPTMAGADTDKRTFYRDAKTFDAQMAALDAYLAKAPYDAQAQFVRAYNLRFSGRATEALAAFRRVLEIAPDHRAAQTFVSALEAKPAAK